MGRWLNKIDLSGPFALASEDKMTPAEFCVEVSAILLNFRLSADSPPSANTGKNSIAISLIELSKRSPTFDDVDHLLQRLYDWGDVWIDGTLSGPKVAWIITS